MVSILSVHFVWEVPYGIVRRGMKSLGVLASLPAYSNSNSYRRNVSLRTMVDHITQGRTSLQK
jgi:hypothetical protein